ncbi:SMC-Scp complex subunit ScpB [Micromonospora sp. DT178]|uniref:SMC-Scp complex subunit ScpB n=1 Tax=Micromonospora sp. DT178 TaxID=3393436 RepID=UPI003CEC2159
MSSEERRDSLADQAAAWVPPWQRPTAPVPAPETGDLGTSTPPEGPEPTKISGDVEGVAADAPGEGGGFGETGGGFGETGGGEGKGGRGVSAKGAAGRRRAAPAPEPAPELDDAELRGALEAILLVVDEPVSELVLAQVLEQPAERIGPMLDEIAAGYTAAGHGFELRRAAGGWRLYTRPEYATYVERFVLDGQSVRLTQAALETLAVVAYKQPVTRGRISAIRGVNCDGVIRTLVSRGLVEECGTEPDSGAFLYRTTTMFLEKLGLNSVDDLPPLAPFLPDDVEELADATR